MDAYFGPNGIEYSVGRVPMGSCDFSVESYSFDDVPGDYNLTHFDDGVARDTAQRVSVRGKGARGSFVLPMHVGDLWYRGTGGEGCCRGRKVKTGMLGAVG